MLRRDISSPPLISAKAFSEKICPEHLAQITYMIEIYLYLPGRV
jgi:hypothetical protein